MSDTRIDQAMIAFGIPRFDLAGLPKNTLEKFNAFKHRAEKYIGAAIDRYPATPPIHFGFADRSELNAYAFRHDEQYFVVLNAGVPLIFEALFMRILAEPTFFVAVGSPSREISGLPVFQSLPPDLKDIKSHAPVQIFPQDPQRIAFAQHLVCRAFDFLVGHEIAHIMHGHVDYLGSRTHSPFLAEFTPAAAHSPRAIIRQTLEMDADAHSITNAMGTLFAHISNQDALAPGVQPFYANIGDAVFHLMFAVLSVFRLFGDASFSTSTLGTSNYPPSRVRQLICLSTALTFLRGNGASISEDEKVEMCGKAFLPVESAFAFLTATPVGTMQGMQDATSPEAMEHQRGLLECWETTLREELLPFAHSVLPKMSSI